MFIHLCTVDIVSTLYYIHLYKALLHWCPKSGFPDIGSGTTILSYRVQTCFLVRENFRAQFKLESHPNWWPLGFHLSFPASIPVTFILDPPSRALNTAEGPFIIIILEDFESSPFTVPLNKVRGKVDSELKILQNRSKYHFWGKGRQCMIGETIQHNFPSQTP